MSLDLTRLNRKTETIFCDQQTIHLLIFLHQKQIKEVTFLLYVRCITNKDLVLAQAWPNKARDWRTGLPNVGTPFVQDFSGTAGWKFYPSAYTTYNVAINEILINEGRLLLGKITNANANL